MFSLREREREREEGFSIFVFLVIVSPSICPETVQAGEALQWRREEETGLPSRTSGPRLSFLLRGSREPQGSTWRQGCSQTVGWGSPRCTVQMLLKQMNLRFRTWIVLKDGFFPPFPFLFFFLSYYCLWNLFPWRLGGSLKLAALRAVCYSICFHFFFFL